MTAKQFVLERYPNTFSFRLTDTCVVIWSKANLFADIFVQANNFKQAWQNAKTKIEEMGA